MGYLYRPMLKKGSLPDGPCQDKAHGQKDTCPTCRARFGKFWWVKYYVNGCPRRESTKCVKKPGAQDFLNIREGAKSAGAPLPAKLDRLRYQELSQDLKTHYETTGSRDSREAGYRLKHLDNFFRNDWAVGITPPRVTQYVQHRQAELEQGKTHAGKTPEEIRLSHNRTINIELSVLKRMLNLAYRNGRLARVPHFDRLTEAPPRSGFFEASQFERLLEHLPHYLRAPMTFAVKVEPDVLGFFGGLTR